MSPHNASSNDHAQEDHFVQEATEDIAIEHGWTGTAQVDDHIAVLLDRLGRHDTAENVRHHAQVDLQQAQHAAEQALVALIRARLEHDIHLSSAAAIAKVRAVQPQVRALMHALHATVQQHVPTHDPMRHEFERLHAQLRELVDRPIEHQKDAVAILETLEAYIHLMPNLAEIYEPVREAWLTHVDTLTNIL